MLDYRQSACSAVEVHAGAAALYARQRAEYHKFIDCKDVNMMRSLVRNGAGNGLLSFTDVAADNAQGRLAFVPLHGRQKKPLTLALCAAPRRQLSRAAQLVIERLWVSLEALS